MAAAVKKEKKPVTYTSPLPPCKVCGAKASGLHYGVNTCEACKGFFRRAVKFQKQYRCFRQQNCDVNGGRSVRTSCPFCRLQKCLNMGMAHTAIKTGRYTHAKRTQNIMEVKRLEYFNNVSADESPTCGSSVFHDHTSFNNTDLFKPQFNTANNSTALHELKLGPRSHIPGQVKVEVSNDWSPCSENQASSLQLKDSGIIDIGGSISSSDNSEVQNSANNIVTFSTGPVLKTEVSPEGYNGMKLLKNEEADPEEPQCCDNFSISFDDMRQTPTEAEGVYISIPSPLSPLSPSSSSASQPFFGFSVPSLQPEIITMEAGPVFDSLPQNVDNQPSSTSASVITSPPANTSSVSVSLPATAMSPEYQFWLASPESLTSSTSSLSSPSTVFEFPPTSVTPSVSDPMTATSPCMSMFFPVSSPNCDMSMKDEEEKITQAVVNAHQQHSISLALCDKQLIYEKQLKYKEMISTKYETFGLVSMFLRDDIYEDIFSQTGLDVDNRQTMFKHASCSFERFLRSVSKFVQAVPGFHTLLLEDQEQLILQSFKEQWFLNAYFGINQQLSVILMPNHTLYTKSELSWIVQAEFAEKSFEMAASFQELDIDYNTLVLWKTMTLFSADRCELKEPWKVEKLQQFYVSCLTQHLKRTQPEQSALFTRIINLTVKLRELSHISLLPGQIAADVPQLIKDCLNDTAEHRC